MAARLHARFERNWAISSLKSPERMENSTLVATAILGHVSISSVFGQSLSECPDNTNLNCEILKVAIIEMTFKILLHVQHTTHFHSQMSMNVISEATFATKTPLA